MTSVLPHFDDGSLSPARHTAGTSSDFCADSFGLAPLRVTYDLVALAMNHALQHRLFPFLCKRRARSVFGPVLELAVRMTNSDKLYTGRRLNTKVLCR